MAALSLDPALKVAPHVILLQKSLGGVSGEGPLRSVQLICSSHVIRSSVGQVQTQNASKDDLLQRIKLQLRISMFRCQATQTGT